MYTVRFFQGVSPFIFCSMSDCGKLQYQGDIKVTFEDLPVRGQTLNAITNEKGIKKSTKGCKRGHTSRI